MLSYLLKNDLFKGKTIIALYRTIERHPFAERKKKLLDSEERCWLRFPRYNRLELRPFNLPIHIVKAAQSVIRTQEELDILRRLVRSSIGNMYTCEKGVLGSGDHYAKIESHHELITDELIDSIIYCVAACEDTLSIHHNLTWLFYGATRPGSYVAYAKELYQELPRITI